MCVRDFCFKYQNEIWEDKNPLKQEWNKRDQSESIKNSKIKNKFSFNAFFSALWLVVNVCKMCKIRESQYTEKMRAFSHKMKNIWRKPKIKLDVINEI